MKEIKQNRWPDYNHYIIEKEGLRLIQKEENRYVDLLIDYEQIGSKEVIVRLKPNPYAVLAYISVLINVIIILAYVFQEFKSNSIINGLAIGAVGPFALWGAQLFKFSKQKIIQGEEHSINFYYKEKHQKEVDDFIKILKVYKSEFFKKKYTKIDAYKDSYTLRSQFIWLKDNDIIDEYELQTLLSELDNRRIFDGY